MDQGRYLHQILADGTIVDNRHYRYHGGQLASPRQTFPVNDGRGLNRVGNVFDFLRAAAIMPAQAPQAH